MLLAANANVDDEDKGGKTPLHFTASADIAQVLVIAGADVDHHSAWWRLVKEHASRNPAILPRYEYHLQLHVSRCRRDLAAPRTTHVRLCG